MQPFLEKKWPFCPKIKKTLSWAVFQEVLIVAPPFLDICLDIYGASINQKISFDWDIILENIAFYAKNAFLKHTFSLSWTKHSPSSIFHKLKHWYHCTDLWIILCFSSTTLFLIKLIFFCENFKHFVINCFSRSLLCSSFISAYLALQYLEFGLSTKIFSIVSFLKKI